METSAKTAMNVNDIFLAIGNVNFFFYYVLNEKSRNYFFYHHFRTKGTSPVTLVFICSAVLTYLFRLQSATFTQILAVPFLLLLCFWKPGLLLDLPEDISGLFNISKFFTVS